MFPVGVQVIVAVPVVLYIVCTVQCALPLLSVAESLLMIEHTSVLLLLNETG